MVTVVDICCLNISYSYCNTAVCNFLRYAHMVRVKVRDQQVTYVLQFQFVLTQYPTKLRESSSPACIKQKAPVCSVYQKNIGF